MSGTTWKEQLRGVSFQKKLFVIVNIVLAAACAAAVMGFLAVGETFETVTAAQRFGGESGIRFAQIACYMPRGGEKAEEDIWSIRQKLETKFVEMSLEAPESGSLFIDAYSTSASLSVMTDHGSAQVDAIGVGGDFFYFHPLRLRSGAYIAERDLMDDLVVLDETLAWRLFGGVELTGMTLYISGEPFVVGGVIQMEDDFATGRALRQEGNLFLSYSALKRLDDTAAIDCYEIVLPDPISGYARGIMEELLPVGEGSIVENSGRFSPARLWELVKSFGERSMRTGAVVYPYWENALRVAEDHAALLLVLAVLFSAVPLVSAVVLVVRGCVLGMETVKRAVPRGIEAAVERGREKRYERAQAKNTEGE